MRTLTSYLFCLTQLSPETPSCRTHLTQPEKSSSRSIPPWNCLARSRSHGVSYVIDSLSQRKTPALNCTTWDISASRPMSNLCRLEIYLKMPFCCFEDKLGKLDRATCSRRQFFHNPPVFVVLECLLSQALLFRFSRFTWLPW